MWNVWVTNGWLKGCTSLRGKEKGMEVCRVLVGCTGSERHTMRGHWNWEKRRWCGWVKSSGGLFERYKQWCDAEHCYRGSWYNDDTGSQVQSLQKLHIVLRFAWVCWENAGFVSFVFCQGFPSDTKNDIGPKSICSSVKVIKTCFFQHVVNKCAYICRTKSFTKICQGDFSCVPYQNLLKSH